MSSKDETGNPQSGKQDLIHGEKICLDPPAIFHEYLGKFMKKCQFEIMTGKYSRSTENVNLQLQP